MRMLMAFGLLAGAIYAAAPPMPQKLGPSKISAANLETPNVELARDPKEQDLANALTDLIGAQRLHEAGKRAERVASDPAVLLKLNASLPEEAPAPDYTALYQVAGALLVLIGVALAWRLKRDGKSTQDATPPHMT